MLGVRGSGNILELRRHAATLLAEIAEIAPTLPLHQSTRLACEPCAKKKPFPSNRRTCPNGTGGGNLARVHATRSASNPPCFGCLPQRLYPPYCPSTRRAARSAGARAFMAMVYTVYTPFLP